MRGGGRWRDEISSACCLLLKHLRALSCISSVAGKAGEPKLRWLNQIPHPRTRTGISWCRKALCKITRGDVITSEALSAEESGRAVTERRALSNPPLEQNISRPEEGRCKAGQVPFIHQNISVFCLEWPGGQWNNLLQPTTQIKKKLREVENLSLTTSASPGVGRCFRPWRVMAQEGWN